MQDLTKVHNFSIRVDPVGQDGALHGMAWHGMAMAMALYTCPEVGSLTKN